MTLRMSVSSNFHPIPKTKPYRTSMALVEATRFIQPFTDYDDIISKVYDA
ncbi:hypothetical protein K1B30_004617 [Vibrio parahaemolyticus]|nr:hypothetical protein [Vibrio parahaemolyticus]EIU6803999.1 hypothetical protein [Vibrio parahaemolyticus]